LDRIGRFRGSILGLAIGDALGHPTEFIASVEHIRERYGPAGLTGFAASGRHPPGTFTDDTQMAIAVARGLVRGAGRELDALMAVMGAEFVAWSRSPENDRAPGGTCLAGCENLARGRPWRNAGVRESKGCGAAMRAAPVGLYFHDDVDRMVRVAAAQSTLTHAHPTAIASGVAAAAPVAWAARGEGIDGMVGFTRDAVLGLSDDDLLALGCDPTLVERHGVREMLAAIDRLEEMAERDGDDVCALVGDGWIGEEAVACGLWCVIRAGGGFRASVLRGANSSGDSDSIAAIAGSIAGAMVGIEGIPPEWVRTVEHGERLDRLARALHRSATTGAAVELEPDLDFFGAVRHEE
jgi:ADP-ribosylglycohydrolase